MVDIHLLHDGFDKVNGRIVKIPCTDLFISWQADKKKTHKNFKVKSIQHLGNALFIVYEY